MIYTIHSPSPLESAQEKDRLGTQDRKDQVSEILSTKDARLNTEGETLEFITGSKIIHGCKKLVRKILNTCKLLKVQQLLGIQDRKDQVSEILSIENACLHIGGETLEFITGSKMIRDHKELIRKIYNACNLLKAQRLLLYRLVNMADMANITELELILLFSLCKEEEQFVGQIVPIQENPNLEQAVKTGKISQIPVESVGVDVALPVGEGYFLALDNVEEAKKFNEKEMIIIDSTTLFIVASYIAGQAICIGKIDERTGLWDNSALKAAIDRGVDIYNRPIQPIHTVAFLDIDHFKQFNTDYGHFTGDAVLKHVADVLTESVESLGGKVFRYGGEEFVATFNGTLSHEEIDSIRLNIQNSVCTFEGKEHMVRVSIGFSNGEHHPLIKEKIPLQIILIKSANKASREAKNNGRNQTLEWKEGMSDID